MWVPEGEWWIRLDLSTRTLDKEGLTTKDIACEEDDDGAESKDSEEREAEEIFARYAGRRREPKAIIKNPDTDERQSATRPGNRDQKDGRPRGYIRKFGLSRINFRDLAHEGMIPGVKKASS